MNTTEKFKKHTKECSSCDEKNPTKLCPIGQMLLEQIVKDNGKHPNK